MKGLVLATTQEITGPAKQRIQQHQADSPA